MVGAWITVPSTSRRPNLIWTWSAWNIAGNTLQAAGGTHQIVQNIANVNREASATGLASAQVLTSAQSLSCESNRLKLEVGKFLMTLRAG